MIILIIITLIPMLAFGYIMYDFFSSKIKKKKNLIKLRDELINRLNIGCVDSATHSTQVRVVSTDETLNRTVFTIWCMYVYGQGRYYDPVNSRWYNFHHTLDIQEGLTYCLPTRFRGSDFYNKFRALNTEIVEIPTIRPSKNFRRHSFTH
jgi:hypothetical protein